ncbi:hypothetical protein N7540_012208 [Penicillium herquei]|nr:hypothetical protein N7540_012208 [Penicillium herquei]
MPFKFVARLSSHLFFLLPLTITTSVLSCGLLIPYYRLSPFSLVSSSSTFTCVWSLRLGLNLFSHLQIPSSVTSSCHSWRLIAITAPSKRRKVSPEVSSSPGEGWLRQRARPSATYGRKSSSTSPGRYYVPAHLLSSSGQYRSQSAGRSPTPATATAGLSISSDHSDMHSEPQDRSLFLFGTDGHRSPSPETSPGSKRPASEISDSDPEGGVSMAVEDETVVSSSIDDKVAQVSALMIKPLKNGQKSFVISSKWLKKVFARSSTHADKADKESLESELGPVDNTDIVLDIGPQENGLKDHRGESYVPMRPGLQHGEHYEIVPQEAWDLIMKWYGLAIGSPVITRYAHDISSHGQPNIVYELSPPIVSIFKLSNPSAGMSPQLLKEKNLLPIKALASPQTNFMKWLKEAKEMAGISMSTKVRVWKLRGGIPSANQSTSSTPAVSRAASPAPAPAFTSSHKTLLLDLNTFLSLDEGAQRELLQRGKDQTNNANYNGKMNLSMAGLVETEALVLEEEIRKGEWVSEASTKTLKKLGIPIEKPKKGPVTSVTSIKSAEIGGRASPAPVVSMGKRPKGDRLGVTGIDNMGNTCYQNAATQCIRAVEELTIYFLSKSHIRDLNYENPLGHHGKLAQAYGGVMQDIYRDPPPSRILPKRYRHTVGLVNSSMAGWEQQDSQEYLMYVLDGLSEDLNRILKKPYIEKPDSTDEMVHNRKALEDFAVQCWDIYKARNDSVITDLFSGMYKSTLVCPECDKVSIMFDPFSHLTLPIPCDKDIIYREVVYLSLNSPPQRFVVEVEQYGTVEAFIKSVAARKQISYHQIIGTESINGSFYQVFDNPSQSFARLRIEPKDVVTFIELDTSDSEDRVLVPLFHRQSQASKGKKNKNNRLQTALFALPTILSFSRQELRDLKAIYNKILRHVATMTTRDILNEQDPPAEEVEEGPEDSDTVVTNDEDARSVDSKVNTSSIEGEEGMVNVSMQDASPSSHHIEDTEEPTETTTHPLADSFPRHLLNLFDVKYVASHETLPKGRMINSTANYPLVTSRIQVSRKTSEASSGDENSETRSVSDRSDGSSLGVQSMPFFRRGDSILLDWNEEGCNALFGGETKQSGNKKKIEQDVSDEDDTEQDEVELGAPTYVNPVFVPDADLINRRAARDAKKESGIELDDCLKEFSKAEVLSANDAWYCPSCKEHREARKMFELWSAPDILVVHLKRFVFNGHRRGKLDTLVKFPLEDLDLSEYIKGPSDGKSLKYDLIGVDRHHGTMGGGHYTAHAKNWVTGDCIINPARVSGSAAYLLFYRRQSAEPLGGPALQKIVMDYRNGNKTSPTAQAEESESNESDESEESEHEHGHDSEEEPEANPLSIFGSPSWSFNQPDDTANNEHNDDEDLFGDNDSNVAVEDGNSEPGDRLLELGNEGSNFEDVPPLLEDGSDDDLPVVELRVGEEDKS